MADLLRSSEQNLILDNLNTYEHVLTTDEPISSTERQRTSKELMHRLEFLVIEQQDRVNAMERQSVGSRPHARRLRALTKENLITCRDALKQVGQSAKNLELALEFARASRIRHKRIFDGSGFGANLVPKQPDTP